MVKLLKNGRDVKGQALEILIEAGRILEMGEKIDRTGDSVELIDCQGKLVVPGFVDLHVHLREPGGEYKETIASGTRAAARGGFTTVCSMPNTKPVPDSVPVLKDIVDRIEASAVVKVRPYASLTQGLQGQVLNPDFVGLKEAGCVAFTDDGVGIQTAGMMKEAMDRAQKIGAIVVAHTEDNSLVGGGVVHKGRVSERLGLPGIPSEAESVQIARDVLLSGQTGCRYHVCHVSSKESVSIIRWAKAQGFPVTAEVSPHHLILSEDDIPGDEGNWKMNPPLRGQDDRQALIEGLMDGTLDCIATDHAPHGQEEKAQSMLKAPFGIVGSELAFQLLYTEFVKKGIFTLESLVDWLTVKPAEVFGLAEAGRLQVGLPADITVLDLDAEWSVDPDKFLSKGRNTPFAGKKLWSDIFMTLVDGQVVYRMDGE